VSKEIEKAYNKFFFQNHVLSDLKVKPELAIGSTNLQTCRPFTFSKRKMEDSAYAYRQPPVKFNQERFPIAKAVAASTCVPAFFTPITIDSQFFKDPQDTKKVRPVLVDGGIYDNQGIQKLTQPGSSYSCDIIITSDAGNKLPFEGAYNNTFILLMRTIEAFMIRIKHFQMANQLYVHNDRKREIAYFSLGWDLDQCIKGFIANLKSKNISQEIANQHGIPDSHYQEPDRYSKEITTIMEKSTNYAELVSNDLTTDELAVARKVKTNLTPLSKAQLDSLIKHAGNLTELQVRLYCPSLFDLH
jgi:NTE family protein